MFAISEKHEPSSSVIEALIYSFQLDYTQNLSQMDSCGFEKHERRKIIIFFSLPSPGSVLIKKYLVS